VGVLESQGEREGEVAVAPGGTRKPVILAVEFRESQCAFAHASGPLV